MRVLKLLYNGVSLLKYLFILVMLVFTSYQYSRLNNGFNVDFNVFNTLFVIAVVFNITEKIIVRALK